MRVAARRFLTLVSIIALLWAGLPLAEAGRGGKSARSGKNSSLSGSRVSPRAFSSKVLREHIRVLTERTIRQSQGLDPDRVGEVPLIPKIDDGSLGIARLSSRGFSFRKAPPFLLRPTER